MSEALSNSPKVSQLGKISVYTRRWICGFTVRYMTVEGQSTGIPSRWIRVLPWESGTWLSTGAM